MKIYLDLLCDILDNGRNKSDRTGVGTRSVFGRQIRLNLNDGFPLLTTKKLHWKSIVAELLWMVSGDTNSKTLEDQGVTIWKEWAREDGDLGPIYGHQWRNWLCPGDDENEPFVVDQIKELVDGLKSRPFSRRHIVSAWNVADLPIEGGSPQSNVRAGLMSLAPCHLLMQFNVEPLMHGEVAARALRFATRGEPVPAGSLSCSMYQRSADAFLGVPYNIASYALLTHMLAQQCNMLVGDLIISFGDLHLYQNHIHPDIVFRQLAREPQPLPKLEILRKPASLFDYAYEDFKLLGYDPWDKINAPIAV